MVKLGQLNSRIRDFFDIWLLARQFDFDGRSLAAAMQRTIREPWNGNRAEPSPSRLNSHRTPRSKHGGMASAGSRESSSHPRLYKKYVTRSPNSSNRSRQPCKPINHSTISGKHWGRGRARTNDARCAPISKRVPSEQTTERDSKSQPLPHDLLRRIRERERCYEEGSFWGAFFSRELFRHPRVTESRE